MKKIIAILVFVVIVNTAYSQDNGLVYNSRLIPQVNTVNPALMSHTNWYLTLPSFAIGLENPFSYNSVFKRVNDTTLKVDGDELLSSIKDYNKINVNAEVGMLGFGINKEKYFVTFSSKFRVYAQSVLPYDLFNFALNGNENYQGQTAVLADGDILNAVSYAEYALGYGHRFLDNKLTVGARVKYLQGFYNLTTENTNLSIYSDADQILATADYRIRMSGSDITKNEYFSKNSGFAFDFGADYKITDKIQVSASVSDIGSIHWKDDLKEIRPENTTQVSFNGLTWDDMWSNNSFNSNFFSAVTDSITEMFDYIEDTTISSYSTKLPMMLSVGGSWQFHKMFKLGLLYQGKFNEFQYLYNANLSVNFSPSPWFELMVCNSAINDDWFNPGFGATLSLFETFQIYVLVDYFSDFYLADSRSVSGRIGFNLNFGKREKKNKVVEEDFPTELEETEQ